MPDLVVQGVQEVQRMDVDRQGSRWPWGLSVRAPGDAAGALPTRRRSGPCRRRDSVGEPRATA